MIDRRVAVVGGSREVGEGTGLRGRGEFSGRAYGHDPGTGGTAVVAGMRRSAGRNAFVVTAVRRLAAEEDLTLSAAELDVRSQESADLAGSGIEDLSSSTASL
ncbi:hypothetical protein GCM10009850_097220 [Nonomuraea monospora]|uniref:Uncharacterized protein n=1 Tax=Nonomuraea monospora TaxID=568818 RepID=A0ABN3CYF5_9ACTN